LALKYCVKSAMAFAQTKSVAILAAMQAESE
jgi:hypothetical protein